MRILIKMLSILILLSLFSFLYVGAEEKDSETSPHGDAIMLVLTTQQETIRKVDQENWWLDIKEREWTVKRPFGPGILDSTHWFIVSYKIDGKTVASWFVDTGEKKVEFQETTPEEE